MSQEKADGVSPLVLTLIVGLPILSGSPLAMDPQRTRLAGHWIQVEPSPSTAGVGPTCGSGCVITQDEKTLTVGGAEGRVPAVFKLDGSPTRTVFGTGPYAAESTVIARWEGSVLVITRQTGRNPVSTNRLVIDGESPDHLSHRSGPGRRWHEVHLPARPVTVGPTGLAEALQADPS